MHHYKIYADFEQQGIQQQQGTGFFIKSAKTGEIYFITNAHVVCHKGLKAYGCTITYFQGNHKHKGSAAAEVIDFKHESSHYPFENDLQVSFFTDIAVLKITHTYCKNFEIHPLEFTTNYENKEEVTISGFVAGILKTIRGSFYSNGEQAAVISQTEFGGGSSGSPVLNSKNQVVALHHRGPGFKHDHINLELIAVPNTNDFSHSYANATKPGTLPVQSICMPTEKVKNFLTTSPYINW